MSSRTRDDSAGFPLTLAPTGVNIHDASTGVRMGLLNSASRLPTLEDVLDLAPANVARYDIAILNLACAAGLPGAESLDLHGCLAKLDRWAEAVRRFSDAQLGDFRRNPRRYYHHEGFAKFLAMVTLLKHPSHLGLRYQPSAAGAHDFSDSRDDFLHGLLTRGLGTCVSLPTLFVAIGRRLGWPMHLATSKRHVFCQWLNPDGTRVNFEGSCEGGGEMLPDESYHRLPFPLTNDDLRSDRYLRPLSAAEEVALFLETRGHCLIDNGRFDTARVAYEQAHRFAPKWSQYDGHIWSLEQIRRRSGAGALVRRNSGLAQFQFQSIAHHAHPKFLFPEIACYSGLELRQPR